MENVFTRFSANIFSSKLYRETDMPDEYYRRMLYTAADHNHKVIIELAFAIAADSRIERELGKVIASLHKSNAALTKLAGNTKICLRRGTLTNLDNIDKGIL